LVCCEIALTFSPTTFPLGIVGGHSSTLASLNIGTLPIQEWLGVTLSTTNPGVVISPSFYNFTSDPDPLADVFFNFQVSATAATGASISSIEVTYSGPAAGSIVTTNTLAFDVYTQGMLHSLLKSTIH
jgi:hypothetical protein